jgi:hypothetical protein
LRHLEGRHLADAGGATGNRLPLHLDRRARSSHLVISSAWEPFDRGMSFQPNHLVPIAKEYVMNGIIYLVGLVVVVGIILSFFGLR